jgi:ACS family hexuronate transporter-like MFS transporter
VKRARWFLAGLLFLITVLNYLDRQVFSILAPDLQDSIGWSELDYSRMVNAFQLAYAITMVLSGRLLDRIGARLGLAASVVLWSVAEAAHAFARTPLGFGVARFALGAGEAANFPAALKAVTEWFPADERALATGLFNSGVALGTIVASIGVPLTVAAYGWRAAFVATGLLGLLWVPFWWIGYGRLARVVTTVTSSSASADPPISWQALLGFRQTWAYALTKSLSDPIWWFYLFWLPKYLAAEFSVRGTDVIPYLTAVYVSADAGCLAAGWLSSAVVKRGWSLNAARKGTMGLLAVIMTPAVIVAGTLHDARLAIALIDVCAPIRHGRRWCSRWRRILPSRAVGSISLALAVSSPGSSASASLKPSAVCWIGMRRRMPIFIAAGVFYRWRSAPSPAQPQDGACCGPQI